MMLAEQVPLWAAIPVMILLVASGLLCVTGALGLLRLSNFYQRMHGPALISTLGTGCMLFASMIFFTAMQSRPVMHELLITAAVLLSAPVTAMMLARAAVFRDRRAGRPDVPKHPGLAGRAGQRPTGERQE